MKNLFKFGFLALAVSLTVAACGSKQAEQAADTAAVTVDTAAVDTAAVDTAAVDTAAAKH